MITIRLKLFAMCREAAGCDEAPLTLQEKTSPEEFWAAAVKKFPGLAPFKDQSRLALNMTYTTGSMGLREGDEIAIIPPVSGG